MKKQSNLTKEKCFRAASTLFWLLVWQAAANTTENAKPMIPITFLRQQVFSASARS